MEVRSWTSEGTQNEDNFNTFSGWKSYYRRNYNGTGSVILQVNGDVL